MDDDDDDEGDDRINYIVMGCDKFLKHGTSEYMSPYSLHGLNSTTTRSEA